MLAPEIVPISRSHTNTVDSLLHTCEEESPVRNVTLFYARLRAQLENVLIIYQNCLLPNPDKSLSFIYR